MARRREEAETRKMELISMVDVIFLLLIFFLVTLATGIETVPSPPGESGEPGKASFVDTDLPTVSNRDQFTVDSLREMSIKVIVDKEGDEYTLFLLDQECPKKKDLVDMRVRIEELQSRIALNSKETFELQRLQKNWNERVQEGLPVGLTDFTSIAFTTFENSAAADLSMLIQQKTNIGSVKDIQVIIEADKSTYYRLLYDLWQICDHRGIDHVFVSCLQQ